MLAPPAENMSQGRRLRYKHTIFYDTVSAVMLLVGTQPLGSQHPPLTAPPLGSAKSSPRWLEANLQAKTDVRREAPRRRRPYLGLLLLLLPDALVFSAARRNREEQTVGSAPLASPPSRPFSTRPHCVLLPLRRSLTPAPTSSVPDCCSGFFNTYLLFIFAARRE